MMIELTVEQRDLLLLVIDDALDGLDMDNLDEVNILNNIVKELNKL